MTDGKLDALRGDPVFSAVRQRDLVRLGALLELVDVGAGEVVSPADQPPRWGYYCVTGVLHVLVAGRPAPQAPGPVLFLPSDLLGVALVAAAPCRVLAVGAASWEPVLALAPQLRCLSRGTPHRLAVQETR